MINRRFHTFKGFKQCSIHHRLSQWYVEEIDDCGNNFDPKLCWNPLLHHHISCHLYYGAISSLNDNILLRIVWSGELWVYFMLLTIAMKSLERNSPPLLLSVCKDLRVYPLCSTRRLNFFMLSRAYDLLVEKYTQLKWAQSSMRRKKYEVPPRDLVWIGQID